jgi:hypothetical protein
MCAPYLRNTHNYAANRRQEHAAHPLRTHPLERPDAGQRSARAFTRPSSMPSRGPRCAPCLRLSTTTPRIQRQEHAAHPLHTHPLKQPDAGQHSTRAFPRTSSLSSRVPRCAPHLGISTTNARIRHQEHAARPLRTHPLEQPEAGQRSTRAFPRPFSMSSRRQRCAPYIRTTNNYAANPIPKARHPPRLEQPDAGQRSTGAFPRPSSMSSRGPKCAPYLSTTRNYAANRRQEQKAHPSSQMLASVAPERVRAHVQCHPEG